MKRFTLACLLVLAATLLAQDSTAPKPKRQMDHDAMQLKHGEYLVVRIGMCGDCHTPIDEKGRPMMDKSLQGAELMFKPTVPVPGWAERSANIAGLKGWTDDEAMKFLTTGIGPNGKPAAPPMPAFRYNKRDAAAVIAYLRSLAPPPAPASSK